ncbi:MAG: AzlD domain-containing protein, partial [Desulfovibrio sp.]|nr:AzlD domain-containing protein [Desulfovibrio sp.]
MPDLSGLTPAFFLTVVCMALATYLTRIAGWLVLRGRSVGPRLRRVLDAAPGCVLLSVIAPSFASADLSELAPLAVVALAATRLGFLGTVLAGVGAAAAVRQA